MSSKKKDLTSQEIIAELYSQNLPDISDLNITDFLVKVCRDTIVLESQLLPGCQAEHSDLDS